MSTQEARNTAAGMVRDALERLVNMDCIQDLRRTYDGPEEVEHWLDYADDALIYFGEHYDFPQEEGEVRQEEKSEVRQLFDPPESYEDYLLTHSESEVTA